MRRFEIEEPSTADIEFLEDRLYEFNAGTTGISDGRSLGVLLRDEAKNIVAGAAGHTWGETCELRQVWVAASIRGRGLGRRLIAEAEAEAVRRGCRQLVLATHSFQAPEFYRRHGFNLVAPEQTAALLNAYWTIPDRQIETSVVLANPPFTEDHA